MQTARDYSAPKNERRDIFILQVGFSGTDVRQLTARERVAGLAELRLRDKMLSTRDEKNPTALPSKHSPQTSTVVTRPRGQAGFYFATLALKDFFFY